MYARLVTEAKEFVQARTVYGTGAVYPPFGPRQLLV